MYLNEKKKPTDRMFINFPFPFHFQPPIVTEKCIRNQLTNCVYKKNLNQIVISKRTYIKNSVSSNRQYGLQNLLTLFLFYFFIFISFIVVKHLWVYTFYYNDCYETLKLDLENREFAYRCQI